MLALPLELIRQVVESIVDDTDDTPYRSDLSAVSLSCRLLRDEAQRILFSDSGELHTTTAARNKTIMFLETIISSPERLALHVKTFNIVFDDWFEYTSDHTTALVQKLSNALQAMRNLESLGVSQCTLTFRSNPLHNILRHVHSELASFRWFTEGYTSPEAANAMADFFRCQNKIKHFAIRGFIDEDSLKIIAAEICPHLRSLSTPYPLTEILLPGKLHITSVQWAPDPVDFPLIPGDTDAEVPSTVELISTELGKIKYLCYDVSGGVSPTGPHIRRLAPYLTSLVCLNTHRGSVKHVEALSQLPRLQFLILEAGIGIYDPWPGEDALIKVITSCKSLDFIDIEDDDNNLARLTYDHFSKTLHSREIDRSDSYTWVDDFDAFDD